MSGLSYFRTECARLERQVEHWRATAAQLQAENTELREQLTDARTALSHLNAGYLEQQAEIARLQAVERSAFRADL